MKSWFTFVSASALAMAVILAASPAWSQGMDFGGDDAPPEDGEEAPVEEELTSAFVFAFSDDEEMQHIARELDTTLRDVMAAHPRFSITAADHMLNGHDQQAAEELQEARRLFDSGREAYINLDLEGAIDNFGEALEIYGEQVAHVSDLNEISECLLHMGAAEILLGRSRQARDYFRRLLLIDPERRPDPDVFPPPVTDAFEREASRISRIRQGDLRISTVPEGANVFVDGIFQGPSPQELSSFRAGEHYVRVRLQGYVEQGEVVEISRRRSTDVEFELESTPEGPGIEEALMDLATEMGESPASGTRTVVEIGALLGVEMLATAYVSRADDGVVVQLNIWDIDGALSVESEQVGPFENDGVIVAGDTTPSFEELLTSAWTAMNVEQVEDEPVVEPPPPPPPIESPPIWRRWWFWTIIGVVVVGAGVGLGVGLGTASQEPGLTQGEVIIDL